MEPIKPGPINLIPPELLGLILAFAVSDESPPSRNQFLLSTSLVGSAWTFPSEELLWQALYIASFSTCSSKILSSSALGRHVTIIARISFGPHPPQAFQRRTNSTVNEDVICLLEQLKGKHLRELHLTHFYGLDSAVFALPSLSSIASLTVYESKFNNLEFMFSSFRRLKHLKVSGFHSEDDSFGVSGDNLYLLAKLFEDGCDRIEFLDIDFQMPDVDSKTLENFLVPITSSLRHLRIDPFSFRLAPLLHPGLTLNYLDISVYTVEGVERALEALSNPLLSLVLRPSMAIDEWIGTVESLFHHLSSDHLKFARVDCDPLYFPDAEFLLVSTALEAISAKFHMACRNRGVQTNFHDLCVSRRKDSWL